MAISFTTASRVSSESSHLLEPIRLTSSNESRRIGRSEEEHEVWAEVGRVVMKLKQWAGNAREPKGSTCAHMARKWRLCTKQRNLYVAKATVTR